MKVTERFATSRLSSLLIMLYRTYETAKQFPVSIVLTSFHSGSATRRICNREMPESRPSCSQFSSVIPDERRNGTLVYATTTIPQSFSVHSI